MNVNTILNYVDLRGDLLTTQFPYNEIDALIFSELAYVNLDQIIEPLHQPPLWLVYQKYVQRNQSLSDQELQKIQIPSHELFEKMASAPRYQNIRILDYVNDVNKELVKQFSALALLLEDGRIVIAFRGTDDSLIGWHEDFLMLCEKSVPAQESSVHFVEHIAKLSIPSSLLVDLKNPFIDASLWQRFKKHFQYQKQRPLWLVGHSKGGNLAIYAACFCQTSIQKRIFQVDNFDGPGFHDEILKSSAYRQMLPYIHSYIPHYSFFGIVLGHEENYTVVKSHETGMMQHNAFSWQLQAHHFEVDELSYESVQFAIKVILFLEKLSLEEKHQFVEAMFSLFDRLNIYNFSDLSHISYKHIMSAIKEITLLKPKTRNMLLEVLHMLWLEAKKIKKG